jgi:putative flippase GtrA
MEPAFSVASFRQLIRFGIVGVAATGLYLLCTHTIEKYARFSTPQAASLAFVPVVVFNYVLHYGWTFRSARAHTSALPRFVGTSIGGWVVNYLVVQSAMRWLLLPPTAALLIAITCVVAWNYLLSSLWVFTASEQTRH